MTIPSRPTRSSPRRSRRSERATDPAASSGGTLGDRPTGQSGDDRGSVDVIDQIRRLAELRASGVLTDEEFEKKKAELLDRL
jgi:hypothetical protein